MRPELQGRLPIRVELRALEHADLPQQYKALIDVPPYLSSERV